MVILISGDYFTNYLQLGCANCGLSFCNKCLKQKCKLPNKGPGDFNVCKLCYSKLAAGSSNAPTIVQPPDVFMKYVLVTFNLS